MILTLSNVHNILNASIPAMAVALIQMALSCLTIIFALKLVELLLLISSQSAFRKILVTEGS